MRFIWKFAQDWKTSLFYVCLKVYLYYEELDIFCEVFPSEMTVFVFLKTLSENRNCWFWFSAKFKDFCVHMLQMVYGGPTWFVTSVSWLTDSYNRFNPYFHMLCILHVCYGWTHNTWTLSAICQQYWIIKYNIFNIVRFAVTPWNDNIRGGFDQTNNNTDICIAQWPIQIYYTAHYKKYKTSREKKAKQIHLRSKNELNG